MRRVLYLSSLFPPVAKVGALRALKFVRHLPSHGWDPVVLADLHPQDPLDGSSVEAVPAQTMVHYDASAAAGPTARAYFEGSWTSAAQVAQRESLRRRWTTGPRRLVPHVLRNEFQSPSFWWPSQELLPLGHYALHIPHAVRAARRILATQPCDVLLVNCEPHASLVVGALVAQQLGLPWVADLRDPWSVCALKRPLRPAPQQAAIVRLEQALIRSARRWILNSQTACDDYRRAFPDVDSTRFLALHNHVDDGLFDDAWAGESPPNVGQGESGTAPFRMVFLGNFREHVDGEVLLQALAGLRAQGATAADVQLLVTGRVPHATRVRAKALDVDELLVDHPFVPYPQTRAFLQTCDLLIALNNASDQRIPAKFYDYLASTRPMLVIGDGAELAEMARQTASAEVVGLHDVDGVVAAMRRQWAAGRQREVVRARHPYTSAAAAKRLADVLDRAVAEHTTAPHAVTPFGFRALLARD